MFKFIRSLPAKWAAYNVYVGEVNKVNRLSNRDLNDMGVTRDFLLDALRDKLITRI